MNFSIQQGLQFRDGLGPLVDDNFDVPRMIFGGGSDAEL